MKVVQLPRGGGKTTALLEWMREAPEDEIRLFVAVTGAEAQRVYRSTLSAHEDQPRWAQPWQFIGFGELAALGAQSGRGRKQIVLGVDNIEMVLARMFHYPVEVVTASTQPDGDAG